MNIINKYQRHGVHNKSAPELQTTDLQERDLTLYRCFKPCRGGAQTALPVQGSRSQSWATEVVGREKRGELVPEVVGH